MSESDVMVADFTPEPDVVEQPARSRGAYKLCMECGQNVLRYNYRAGSSICKPCEVLAQGGAPVEVVEALLAPHEAEQGQADATVMAAVPQDEELVRAVVSGSLDARDWLAAACGQRTPEALTLDVLAGYLRELKGQHTQMIGRVTQYGATRAALKPEDIPLEIAAQALWLWCDPLLQERLTAACEVLQLSLNQVILGNLAYHDQDLLDQDQSLVPQAPYTVQFGHGGRQGSGHAVGRSGLPGGRQVDASGQLVKDCLCCGRAFHPPAARPNPDFCDDACGTFADQLRIWATNTVLDDLRYPGQRDRDPAPLPDPRPYWPVERCQEPYLRQALDFREQRVAQQMEQARAQQQKMRGL